LRKILFLDETSGKSAKGREHHELGAIATKPPHSNERKSADAADFGPEGKTWEGKNYPLAHLSPASVKDEAAPRKKARRAGEGLTGTMVSKQTGKNRDQQSSPQIT